MNTDRPQQPFLLEPPPREGWKLFLIGALATGLGLALLAGALVPIYF
jgi:hypothetical protein